MRRLIGPRRKNGTFYKKRRAYGRRALVSRAPSVAKVRTSLGFPDRMITKLEYRTTGTLNSLLGVTATADFNLNSIYDPEVALGGHQPLWTDQYQAIYNKYRVFKCVYNVQLVGLSTSGTPCNFVALSSAQAPGVMPSTIGDAWEQNRTKNRMLAPGPDTLVNSRGSISLPKLQGQTATAFKGDDGNFAILTANPVNPATLRIMLESLNSGVASVQYSYNITLTYFVEFFDRITPHVS